MTKLNLNSRGIKSLHEHGFEHCTVQNIFYLIISLLVFISVQFCNEHGKIFVHISDYFLKFLEVKLEVV